MAEISYYDADLTDAVEKLNEAMDKWNKAPPGVKSELLHAAEKKVKEAVELQKGYQLAMRQAPRDQAKQFRDKFEELSARVEELSGEVKWARSEQDRIGLFGPQAAASEAAARKPGGSNKELLDRSLDVQKKTEQSLVNTQKMVDESKEVALATGERLREQRQQIVSITDDVMRMEDSLHRADRLVRAFARRMATDRLILVMTLLVFLGIAGIVVYKSMHPKDKTFYVPDEVTPPNPVALYNKTASAINATIHSIRLRRFLTWLQ